VKVRRVDYSPEAELDFLRLYDVIADASGPDRAASYVGRVLSFCNQLELASERGHRRDDVRPGLRILGFERRITIAFFVESERVVVLRLFYGGADWERVF
jgi:Plasmid stabilization system protein